jgi:hypothetical protein
MKLRRSLYARPESSEESSAPRRGLDRGATPSSCLVTAVVTVALAVLPSRSRPWLPSRKRRPHRRGLGVSRRAALWSWRSRMSECLPCRSSVPLSASLPVRLACPVEGTVSGRTRPGMRCPEPVRSWRPSWTPTRPRGHRTGSRLADVPARLGLAEGGHAHCRLSGQGQDEQAAWLAVAGWLGAWSGAGRWRCPPLGRRRPDRSVPIG